MTILEMWKIFSTTLPPNCSRVQREETQKAFYGGVLSVMEANFELAEKPEEEGVIQLEAWRMEYMKFFKDLIGV